MAPHRTGIFAVLALTLFTAVLDAAEPLLMKTLFVAIAAFGGYLVLQGQATVGTVIAFLGYIGGLFGPMQGLTGS